MSPRARRWLIVLAGAALLSAATGHALCDLAFDCGCTWMVAGADAHCDVHAPAPPNCPVCSDMRVGAAFASGLMAAWTGVMWAGLAAAGRARA